MFEWVEQGFNQAAALWLVEDENAIISSDAEINVIFILQLATINDGPNIRMNARCLKPLAELHSRARMHPLLRQPRHSLNFDYRHIS